ncbi:MAG: serine/threonine protein kinase [Proteobacteria bacterium]|nr:serine/threonine protein kinase [Pseudomonadota bacterium]
MTTPDPQHGHTEAFAEFAFGSHTQVIDTSRPLAWLSPEEMAIDLSDPQQRRFGDYELIEKIGQGGMGVVYRARQHGLERDVAIKLLAAGPWASDEFVERFRREARSAARMQHPNIVEIYEFGHREGLNYFSMRLIEGRSLAQRLNAQGPLPAMEAAKLLRTLAEAMDYAHRLGVLHLDLKPANVLLTQDGTPLIADFGLARRVDAGHDGGSNEVSGTPSYMAPEQATLEMHPLTTATDIYGLGAILYETLTGQPPFRGTDPQATLERVVTQSPTAPRSLRKDIPTDLEAICLKCLEKDPAQRYASAQELADDLTRFVEGRAVSVRPLGAMQRLGRWARREPRLAGAIAAAMLALLVGAGATTWQWRQALAQRNVAQRERTVAQQERDRAAIASEIGGWLFTRHGDKTDSNDQARGLIAFLRERLPGDEERQADALTTFATSLSRAQGDDGDLFQLLSAIVATLGVDYRHHAIQALRTSSDKYRLLHSAMLAYGSATDPKAIASFRSLMHAAINERPNDPIVWQAAAIYCPWTNGKAICLFPQAAAQMVRVDPDNMYSWLLLAINTDDTTLKRKAIHEAARRNRFDEYFIANMKAYFDALHAAAVPVPPMLARPIRMIGNYRSAIDALAAIDAGNAPLARWSPLVRFCLPQNLATLDRSLHADCLTIGTRMMKSDGATNTILARMIGVALVQPLARGTALAESARQVRREYKYVRDATDKLPPRQAASYSEERLMRDVLVVGELAAWQRRLAYFGVPAQPPPNWQPSSPLDLMSSRERLDAAIAIDDHAATPLAQGRFAEAADTLGAGEKQARALLAVVPWRLARYLVHLGQARAGIGQFAAAEQDLLDAWKISEQAGPSSGDARNNLQALV